MIHLINATTGTLFRSVNAFSPMCLDWSLDGKWLVYGSLYGHVAVWMAHGREHAQSEHIYGSYWVSVIACLDDGCILVVSSQTAVTYDLHVVRMEHYNELVTLWSRPGSGGYCLSSPLYEKRYLLVSMNKAQRVDVWDIQQKCIVKHYSKINKYCGLCARVGKDVRYTAIVDGRDMVLYDEQDVPVLRVSEHAKRVLGIVGNPVHLDQFVSISRDGTACVWAITTDPVEQEERDIINWAWMD
jgi:WD40 repeat protein